MVFLSGQKIEIVEKFVVFQKRDFWFQNLPERDKYSVFLNHQFLTSKNISQTSDD
jgi:hypothetical protein